VTTNKFAIHSTSTEPKKSKKDKDKANVSATHRSETPKTSAGNDFTFPDGSKGISFPDGSYQVYIAKGHMSKKFKKESNTSYSGLFTPSHATPSGSKKDKKRKFDGKENKNTVAWASQYKKDHPSMSWTDVYQEAVCDTCGKGKGHVTEDCRKRNRKTAGVHSTDAVSYGQESEKDIFPMRNVSGFFSCHMTNAQSVPVTEEQVYMAALRKLKNRDYVNLDPHANIHVWNNRERLTNVRKIEPVSVTGFGGFTKTLDTIGDHPLFGEVFVDEDNAYNIISSSVMRKHYGYFRRITKDNKTEFLYSEEHKSVFRFDEDPDDGFYKISFNELNREMRRAFPNVCKAVS
jgi:hypothetical protein